MKHYLSKEHIYLLNFVLGSIPKYDFFSLTDISGKIAQADDRYKGWTYLLSKITAIHGDIFTELWLSGFIEITDREKGICKLTPDGHKLKDIGDYDKYLKQVKAEYSAKKGDYFIKTYWYLPIIITYLLGLLTSEILGNDYGQKEKRRNESIKTCQDTIQKS